MYRPAVSRPRVAAIAAASSAAHGAATFVHGYASAAPAATGAAGAQRAPAATAAAAHGRRVQRSGTAGGSAAIPSRLYHTVTPARARQSASAPGSASPTARSFRSGAVSSGGGSSAHPRENFFTDHGSPGTTLMALEQAARSDVRRGVAIAAAQAAGLTRLPEDAEPRRTQQPPPGHMSANMARLRNLMPDEERRGSAASSAALAGDSSLDAQAAAVAAALDHTSASYGALLTATMSTPTDQSGELMLRIIDSWFSALPESVLSVEQRDSIIADALRQWYIRHNRRMDSRVGEAPEASGTNVATTSAATLGTGIADAIPGRPSSQLLAPSFGQSGGGGLRMQSLHNTVPPKDLFRDIILAHSVPLSLSTIKLLTVHSALRRDTQETVATIHFLKHYAKHMKGRAARAPDAQMHFEQAAQAAAAASPSGAVESLHSSLHIDIGAFNSLLEIFSHHGDEGGATLLFTELSPAGVLPQEGLLFGRLAPDLGTYTALVSSFCKNNHVENALALVEHVRSSHSAWLARGGVATALPEHTTPPPQLDMNIFEVMMATLVSAGHIQSAVLVLQKLQVAPGTDPAKATNSFGLPPPSLQCFLPLLLDIPRFKESRPRLGSYAHTHAHANAFDGLAADEQLMLLAELYGSFRAAGHQLPEGKLLLFLERVALMGSGMEVVATGESTNVPASAGSAAAAAASMESEGFGERGLQLVSHVHPPRGATPAQGVSPFSNPAAPVDFAVSVLNDRLSALLAADPAVPLPPSLAGSVPSVSAFNSLLFLFGVVLCKADFLAHFVSLMQRLSLSPNIHTMNALLESYARGGVGANVAYMYEQIKAATAAAAASGGTSAPGAIVANVQTFNCMLSHMELAAPALTASATATATAGADAGAGAEASQPSPLDPLRSLLGDMKSLGVAPNKTTWLLVLRQILLISGNGPEAQQEGLLPPLGSEVSLGVARPLGTQHVPGDNAPFARPVERQGAVFELVHLLAECQASAAQMAAAQAAQAAAASAASSPSAPGPAELFGAASLPALLANLPSLSSPSASPSASAAGAAPVLSGLTPDVAALYMTAAGKLSDVRSVMRLLEAMKLNASAQGSAAPNATAAAAVAVAPVAAAGAAAASGAGASSPGAVALVGRALPPSFCRDYFSDRTHLRAQLHYRLTQMDWGNSVALLRIWQALGAAPARALLHGQTPSFPSSAIAGASLSSRTSGGAGGAGGEMTDVDNFAALFRRIADPATLANVVRECFLQLVWGLDPQTGAPGSNPLSPALLPVSVRQAAVRNVASGLMLHGRFDALLAFLDLVADMATRRDPAVALVGGGGDSAGAGADAAAASASAPANLVVPFPPQLLPEIFHKALHHGGIGGGGGGGLHGIGGIGGVKVDLRTQLGILSRLVRGGSWHALVAPSTQAKLDALELASLVLSEGIEGGRGAAELWQVMSLALSIEEPEHNWLAGDRVVPASLRQFVRLPQLLSMADKLLAHWAPMPTVAAAMQRGGGGASAAVEDALASERLPYVQLLLQQFVTSADAYASRYTHGVPQPIAPLLSPSLLGGALLYAMAHANTPVVVALWRYAHGMAHPGLAYYRHDELLPLPVPLDPEAAATADRLKLRQPRQTAPLIERVQEHLLAYSLGHATASSPLVLPSFTAAISPPAVPPAVEYPLAPNPGFGWEVYVQQLLRRAPISTRVFRAAILLQGCYPPIAVQGEGQGQGEGAAGSAAASAGASSTSSNVPSQLGRAQLMHIWKNIQDRLLWFEALGLLPHVMGVLVGQRFHPDAWEDLQLKEVTLGMLAGWAAKHARKQLPPIETVQQMLAGAASHSHGHGGGGGHGGLVQTNSVAWQRMQPAVQEREEKKLAEVRGIVDATIKACTEKLKQVRVKLSGAGLGPAAAAARNATRAGAGSEPSPAALGLLSGQAGFSTGPGSSASAAAQASFLQSPPVQRLSASYERMLARLAHPAPLEGDASIEAKILELFRSPRDFVDLTFYKLRQGAFADARPAAAQAQAQAQAARPPALVFFDFMTKLLSFVAARGLQTTFVRFMQSVAAHPQGLLTVLTPAAIKPTAAPAVPTATGAAAVQPQEDVAVALLDTILRRRQLADNAWKPVVELGSEAAAAAAASSASSPSPSFDALNPLELLYVSHPSWWACQALYWHFKAHQLDTKAFDLDLLFTVNNGAGATGAAGAGAGAGGASLVRAGVNPLAITPRKVYSWVSHADQAPRSLLMLAYESAFRFLVAAVAAERGRSAKSLGGAHTAQAVIKGQTASTPASTSFSSAGSAASSSPAAHSLHYYTFQLFKQRYASHRAEGVAAGRGLRVHKDLVTLEAALKAMLAAPSIAASAEVGLRRATGLERAAAALAHLPAHSVGGALSSGSRGNTVYELFANLSLSHPQALSENVYNMVLASLCLLAHTGMAGARRAQVQAVARHMTQVLCYRMQPVTLGYVIDSCIEQAALDCIAATATEQPAKVAAAESGARELLEFASALLEEHKHPRGVAFDFGSEKEGMVEPTEKPVFPPHSPCN